MTTKSARRQTTATATGYRGHGQPLLWTTPIPFVTNAHEPAPQQDPAGHAAWPWLAIACLAMVLGGGNLRAAGTRVFDIAAPSPVAEFPVTLTAVPGSHVVELRNFDPQADPVVHVLSGSFAQVGSAAPIKGRVAVTLPGTSSGRFLIVVRSQSASSIQTGDLWLDGKPFRVGVTFTAGAAFRMTRLASSEKVMGVRGPAGPASHIAYLLSIDGLTILRRSVGADTSVSLPSTGDALAVFATGSPSDSGPIRVYRNDAGHDSDGDGLGDELEAALGTCASKTGSVAGVNCNEIADPRDTDGDGLQDGWEVMGLSVVIANVAEELPLPTWGANPRHKDIFVEVDFRRLNLAENQQQLALHMSPAVARQMAATYADAATTDPWIKAIHSLSVNNPDRLPGISLHLDTGVPPETAADATIYGDWGGYNAVDALATGPQDPGAVWQQQMSRARQGVFHYAMGYTTGGGSCGEGIACGFNMADPGNSAHEFGHTIGLNHNGPYTVQDEPNCKPNYPSLMNYAYLLSGYMQFSDGRNFPNFNNHALIETHAVDPANQPLLNSLQYYFGYTVDRTTGSIDWNRDGQFSPSTTAVRAYANYQPGGECEFTREGEQDTQIKSEHSPAVLRFNNTLWMFAVDANGKLAYTWTVPGWNCAQNNLDNCPAPQFPPAGTRDLGPLASIDAKTMIINGQEMIILVGVRPDGSLIETYLSLIGNLQAWGAVFPIAGSPVSGEVSLANPQDKSTLALTYKGQDNIVRLRFRSASGWSAEQQPTVAGNPIMMYPDASPAVAYAALPLGITAFGDHLILAASDQQGYIELYTPQFPGNKWGRIGIPYGPMFSRAGRPVMAWTGASGTVATQAIAAAAVAVPAVQRVAAASTVPAVKDLAAAVTVPPVNVGRFYILYLQYNAPAPVYHSPTNPMRLAMSYVDSTGHLRIGLDSYFDNEWSYAYGMSVLTPTDGALRAAVTSAVLPNHGTVPLDAVYFRPHADGITDLTYHNYDDWKTLAHDSCTVLSATQPGSQVACAPIW